jgi:hypothetical protein
MSVSSMKSMVHGRTPKVGFWPTAAHRLPQPDAGAGSAGAAPSPVGRQPHHAGTSSARPPRGGSQGPHRGSRGLLRLACPKPPTLHGPDHASPRACRGLMHRGRRRERRISRPVRQPAIIESVAPGRAESRAFSVPLSVAERPSQCPIPGSTASNRPTS